jgi:hypothetical protein
MSNPPHQVPHSSSLNQADGVLRSACFSKRWPEKTFFQAKTLMAD